MIISCRIIINFIQLLAQLKYTAETIRNLTNGVTQEQASWKPDPTSWSILVVLNHLYDEERQDFRVRLDFILNRRSETPPVINPLEWVISREYNQGILSEAIDHFTCERHRSLNWITETIPFDPQTSFVLPFGTFKAGDMFAAWVAHDLLHTRQLV